MKAIIVVLVSLITVASLACEAQTVDANAPLAALALADGRSVLTADASLTAYVFDVDTTSESQCYDTCAEHWPAVLAPVNGQALGANIATTVRKDGSLQLTHMGRPVYFFFGDKAPGDINGDGLGGVWHIITL